MDTRSSVDCAFFLKGLCNKGSFCPFKHDPVSRRASPTEQAGGHAVHAPPLGVLLLLGLSCCSVQGSPPCAQAAHLRVSHCPFSLALQSKIGSVRQEQAKVDCLFFKQGRCIKGSLCPFRHDQVRETCSLLHLRECKLLQLTHARSLC